MNTRASYEIPAVALWIAWLLLPTPALGVSDENLYSWERALIETGTQAAQMNSPGAPCGPSDEATVSCAALSDQFCENLWSPENLGSLDVADSRFRMGKSKQSALSVGHLMDLNSWLDAEPRLPPDLRAAAAPILAKLRQALTQETDTRVWSRSISLLEWELGLAIDDTARKRTEARHPGIEKIKTKDLTIEQTGFFSNDAHAINEEVLRARYEENPQWLRVKKVFTEVIQDHRARVNGMNLSPELKASILQKLSTIRLTLPFSDPRKAAADPDCMSTEVNAYYYPTLHIFTVCAGMFNTMQDEAALYTVLAHEVGHSFDAGRLAQAEMDRTPIGAVVQRLCHAKGSEIPCDEWERIRTTVFAPMPAIPEPSPPLRALTSCLKTEAHLRPWDKPTLDQVALTYAAYTMHSYAERNTFTELAQPTYRDRTGKVKSNELYLRADLRATRDGKGIPPAGPCISMTAEAFVQNLACSGYPQAPLAERAAAFDRALTQTEEMQRSIFQQKFAICGRDCAELAAHKLGRSVSEDTSDWYANNNFPLKLAREPSLARRRQMAAGAGAHLCPTPSPLRDAQDLTVVEKKRSLESHPDERPRRLRLFTPEVARLVNCQGGASELGENACHL